MRGFHTDVRGEFVGSIHRFGQEVLKAQGNLGIARVSRISTGQW